VGACILLFCGGNTLLSKKLWFPPTQYKYEGNCYSNDYIDNKITIPIKLDTCVWGIPASAYVTNTGLWIHFVKESSPYKHFAAFITVSQLGDLKVTENNILKIYGGKCIEVYGKLIYSDSRYSDNQLIINVNLPEQIRFCK
jgi:hypothetical protein